MGTTRTFISCSSARWTPRVLAAPVLAGVVVAATLSVPAGASTSTATSKVSLTDATGDVWSIGEGEHEEYRPAADMPTADVVRAEVQHRRGRVVVRMDFTDLRREDPASYTAMIITPEKMRAAFVMTGPRRWAGKHMLVNGNYGNVRCPGFEHSVDYDADQVVMTLPRTCLGRPRWVRVSMANSMFKGDTEATFQEITDNPHGADADGGTTGRIYRAPSQAGPERSDSLSSRSWA